MANRIPQPDGDQVITFHNRLFSEFSVQQNISCIPVDQAERQRFEDFDGILRELFHARTVFPPFPPGAENGEGSETPTTVLDCGFGRGTWIESVMDEYGGDLDVTGVDIFLNQDRNDDDDDNDSNGNGSSHVEEVQEFVKKRWNLNAPFREDRSDDRLRPESFDLINSRLLAEGINSTRWSSYVRDLKHLLKPGGWLQMVEIQYPFQSSNGSLGEHSSLNRWWQWYSWALQQMGKNPRIGRDLYGLLTAERFEHVTAVNLDLPIGTWNAAQASLGRDNLASVDRMLTSHSLWPFLRVGRMSEDAYRALIAGAREEIRQNRYQLYFKVYATRIGVQLDPSLTVSRYVVYGQRPPVRRRR